MKKFKKDYENFSGKKYNFVLCVLRTIKNYELRFLFFLRLSQKYNSLILNIIINHYMNRYGIEIFSKNIGYGLRLIHPWGITVNANAKLGNNVTLFKGVTIGVIEDGSKKGNPTIQDDVTVYANATICVNVTIGHGSTIASGSFVNFNVPPNSIVIGNPGIIHEKK